MSEQTKEIADKVKDTFDQQIKRFGQFWDILQGHHDSQVRADVILNPKTPQTSTNLSGNQVDYVTICKGISVSFPELAPLEDGCDEFLKTSISKDGFGVVSMIQYEQAIGEKRMLQLGMKPQTQEPQKDKQKNAKE